MTADALHSYPEECPFDEGDFVQYVNKSGIKFDAIFVECLAVCPDLAVLVNLNPDCYPRRQEFSSREKIRDLVLNDAIRIPQETVFVVPLAELFFDAEAEGRLRTRAQDFVAE